MSNVNKKDSFFREPLDEQAFLCPPRTPRMSRYCGTGTKSSMPIKWHLCSTLWSAPRLSDKRKFSDVRVVAVVTIWWLMGYTSWATNWQALIPRDGQIQSQCCLISTSALSRILEGHRLSRQWMFKCALFIKRLRVVRPSGAFPLKTV